jgi:hypothetical protein
MEAVAISTNHLRIRSAGEKGAGAALTAEFGNHPQLTATSVGGVTINTGPPLIRSAERKYAGVV